MWNESLHACCLIKMLLSDVILHIQIISRFERSFLTFLFFFATFKMQINASAFPSSVNSIWRPIRIWPFLFWKWYCCIFVNIFFLIVQHGVTVVSLLYFNLESFSCKSYIEHTLIYEMCLENKWFSAIKSFALFSQF